MNHNPSLRQWGEDDQRGDDRCVECNHKGYRHEVDDDGALGRCYGFTGSDCDCTRFVSPA